MNCLENAELFDDYCLSSTSAAAHKQYFDNNR